MLIKLSIETSTDGDFGFRCFDTGGSEHISIEREFASYDRAINFLVDLRKIVFGREREVRAIKKCISVILRDLRKVARSYDSEFFVGHLQNYFDLGNQEFEYMVTIQGRFSPIQRTKVGNTYFFFNSKKLSMEGVYELHRSGKDSPYAIQVTDKQYKEVFCKDELFKSYMSQAPLVVENYNGAKLMKSAEELLSRRICPHCEKALYNQKEESK